MKWSDEYWPLLIKEYKKKPEGVKPVYTKNMVDLSLYLHIPPQELHKKMLELRALGTPSVQRVWQELADNPRKLTKAVKIVKERQGLGNASEFFEGVETNESFERDFRPLEEDERLKPVHLIMILNLYFQLTPNTMVAETEEVQELAKILKLPVKTILEIMEVFQFCDPYLNRDELMIHPLVFVCKDIWNRYGNDDIEKLESLAGQLREYFK